MGTDRLVAKAEGFIWRNARLVDRRRYTFHFMDGSREPVVAALRAYLNDDGGFGHALEPDMRCPDSQPVFQQVGLEMLDEVGFEDDIVAGVCEFLSAITTGEGGVPNVSPSVLAYPHAPWWDTDPNLSAPANTNPTAAIAGLLHKHEVEHLWLAPATEYCWGTIEGEEIGEVHALLCAIAFLENAPDEGRARRAFGAIGARILAKGLVCFDPHDEGYVKKPLDWAPGPESWCRGLFDDAVIDQHLHALAGRQQDDGGWPISWEGVSPACEMEWRGNLTVNSLLTLRAYGRI